MYPSFKKFSGILIILIGLTLYALLVSRLIEAFFADHIVLQLICYLVAGIVWIFPAYWVLKKTST
ncbi:DUF2842 domain-containing protein [Emcibacter sp.]|uniref:DUF2842 domain-containing protein n=1 Tax=Emcibacter sp. TaxID=1979954 RepID=UPI002AA8C9F5|nr:DUF2842 domain-containing protein [Emcibacter sp.]